MRVNIKEYLTPLNLWCSSCLLVSWRICFILWTTNKTFDFASISDSNESSNVNIGIKTKLELFISQIFDTTHNLGPPKKRASPWWRGDARAQTVLVGPPPLFGHRWAPQTRRELRPKANTWIDEWTMGTIFHSISLYFPEILCVCFSFF